MAERTGARRWARLSLLAGIAAIPVSPALAADDADPPIVVTGQRSATIEQPPSTSEGLDAARIDESINVVNVEDMLRYLPSLFVRKRHIGDTQAPLATRTSGVGASARSLIYADGVLLSALIGNNNSTASPRWGMVSPEEIERIDVLYGPFSAAYPGNSIGAVVNMITRNWADAIAFSDSCRAGP
jgi:iron complex outermembrane receptor protein